MTQNILEIWESGVDMATAMARKRARRTGGKDFQDFEQAALMALWVAANYWRDDCGTTFTSYAYFHVRTELNKECWRQGFWGYQAGKMVSEKKYPDLPAVELWPTRKSGNSEEGTDKSEAWIPSVETQTDFIDDKELLQFIISQLKPVKLQTLARRHWLEGLSCATIAHQFNQSEGYTFKMRNQAFAQMCEIAETLKTMWNR